MLEYAKSDIHRRAVPSALRCNILFEDFESVGGLCCVDSGCLWLISFQVTVLVRSLLPLLKIGGTTHATNATKRNSQLF